MTIYRNDPSPIPNPIPITAPFWAGTKEHKLLLQRCRDGHVFYYARSHCPNCLSNDLEWIESSGRGTLYSFTVCERAQSPEFNGDIPYIVGAIALEEGPRMTSLIVGVEPSDVHCDMPVEVVWQDVNDELAMPYFRRPLR